MEDILKQLHEEVLKELQGDSDALESLGTSAHQLKSDIEGFIEEVRRADNLNPYDFTNRVLVALDRHRRLRM